MSADLLREAAAKMRERAEAADTHGRWVLAGPDDEYAPPWTVMSSHEPGDRTWVCERARYAGEHIASWHPAVAIAVADWLDSVAAVHWPKRHDRLSESHYNAEPEHDYLDGDCDESCWSEAYICNGCGTAECKPEISGRALAVARAYLGSTS